MKSPSPAPGSAVSVDRLVAFRDTPVRLRLREGGDRTGRMRTELLTERSLAVFLVEDDRGGGETVYLDEIAAVEPLH